MWTFNKGNKEIKIVIRDKDNNKHRTMDKENNKHRKIEIFVV